MIMKDFDLNQVSALTGLNLERLHEIKAELSNHGLERPGVEEYA